MSDLQWSWATIKQFTSLSFFPGNSGNVQELWRFFLYIYLLFSWLRQWSWIVFILLFLVYPLLFKFGLKKLTCVFFRLQPHFPLRYWSLYVFGQLQKLHLSAYNFWCFLCVVLMCNDDRAVMIAYYFCRILCCWINFQRMGCCCHDCIINHV